MHKTIALLIAACALLMSTAFPVYAADTAPPPGIALISDYPSLTLQAGNTSNITLSLRNHNTPAERFALSLTDVPKGWTAKLLGGGQPVASAMPGTNDTLSMQLRLVIPKQTDSSVHTLIVHADSPLRQLSLPIEITLADQLPPKLSIQTDLPQLTGSTKTAFDYQLTIKNDSGQDALASLAAQVPQYFDASFTEGYGSQQISAVPIKAGESKNVKLHIRPPAMAQPGIHPITVTVASNGTTATAALKLELTGQAQISLTGRDGLMSTTAQVQETSNVPLELHNSGAVAAQDIQLNGTAPPGWKLEFEPARVDTIAPDKTVEVQAHITPSAQSLAGDYMVSLHARSQGQSADGDLRVSVTTSSLWGVSGAILIAIALLILIGAVARYGRR